VRDCRQNKKGREARPRRPAATHTRNFFSLLRVEYNTTTGGMQAHRLIDQTTCSVRSCTPQHHKMGQSAGQGVRG
jgi:hypothetical protein